MKILMKTGYIIYLVTIAMAIVNLIIGEFTVARLVGLIIMILIFSPYLQQKYFVFRIDIKFDIGEKSFDFCKPASVAGIVILVVIFGINVAEFAQNIGFWQCRLK